MGLLLPVFLLNALVHLPEILGAIAKSVGSFFIQDLTELFGPFLG